MLARGLRELAPKRFDAARVLASLAWSARSRAAARGGAFGAYLGADDGQDTRLALSWLDGFQRVRLGTSHVSGLLDELATLSLPTCLAVAGAHHCADGPQASLARALSAQTGRREQALLSSLTAYGRDALGRFREHVLTGDPPVVEERPGRAAPLRLEAPTLKQQLKRWQAAGGKAGAEERQPLPPVDGFGVAAAAIAPDGLAEAAAWRSIAVASCDMSFSVELGLDLGARIVQTLEEWLQRTGTMPLASFRTIVLSEPWPALAAAIGEALGSQAKIRHPDLVFGWHPSASLLEALLTQETPVLYLATGEWPLAHAMVVGP